MGASVEESIALPPTRLGGAGGWADNFLNEEVAWERSHSKWMDVLPAGGWIQRLFCPAPEAGLK
jgi:hypothetical protein